MYCPCCELDNPGGLSRCRQCRTPLTLSCPNCGSMTPLPWRFCGYCGTPLSPAQLARTKAERSQRKGGVFRGEYEACRAPLSRSPLNPETEYRRLTVMFCDLVNSTTLSYQCDPEELREVICEYQRTCAKIIHRSGGRIAQYLGDRFLIYFGYPLRYDDDAARAVRAGVAILIDLSLLNARLQHEVRIIRDLPLQVRMSLHTGHAVVSVYRGGYGGKEQLKLGEMLNVAARLQAKADPNTLVISPTTYWQIQNQFVCEPLGSLPAQGYRVLYERNRSQLEATTPNL
jgi:class 3 adenylate cyclase